MSLDNSIQASLSSQSLLQEATFPFALRDDGLARTYVDEQGARYLQPLAQHDFNFSALLFEHGISGGEVVEVGGVRYVRYQADTELVSLPGVINAVLNTSRDAADVVGALVLTMKLLATLKNDYDVLPATLVQDAVCIDRWGSRAEILVPFQLSRTTTLDQLFQSLREDTLAAYPSPDASQWLDSCFATAWQNWSTNHE